MPYANRNRTVGAIHESPVQARKPNRRIIVYVVGTPVLGRPKPADFDGICDITIISPFGFCLHRTPRERRPYRF